MTFPSSTLVSNRNFFLPQGYHIGTKGVRPWCHTLSNRVFGTLLSDMSLGFTWALNSRQNKLTPWSNDVCSDFHGEKIYIKINDGYYDALSGADVAYYDNMGVYTCKCGKLSARITVQVDKVAMKKRIQIKLEGETEQAQVIYALTPQLGESSDFCPFVRQISPENAPCVVLQNPLNRDYKGFMGLCASLPFSLERQENTYRLTAVPEKDNPTVCFYTLFGSTLKSIEALRKLPFRESTPKTLHFTSFSPALNAFGSALLLHNVRDTRLFARCGFYQCSGAYGFRDQLQDAAALIPYEPERGKIQILRSCAAQFAQGDVLHWYHTVPNPRPCFKGVRTHCSDDLLWLPLTLAEYVTQTGDREILRIPVAFLEGEELQKGEKERYGEYFSSGTRASVYEHCIRAIKHSLTLGEHSLPLIKAGDWNDSFSQVGRDFKGESVWLAQFLRLVCLNFMPLCDMTGSPDDKIMLGQIAEKMKKAVEKHGWNGRYFIRGYFDNGDALGDETSPACKIDLLPQAFGVFAQTGTREMQLSALSHAYNQLFDRDSLTLKLFTPPFSQSSPRGGYVNDYPQGTRENGGQYTHAAVWFALALHRAGLTKEAKALCEILCPASASHTLPHRENGDTLSHSPTATHSQTANSLSDSPTAPPGKNGEAPSPDYPLTLLNSPVSSPHTPLSRYQTEPYAMTGDVCTEGRFKGKGGWSLYTGSAGWYLRLLTELSGEQ